MPIIKVIALVTAAAALLLSHTLLCCPSHTTEHGVKFSLSIGPCGLPLDASGPDTIRASDDRMYKESGLEERVLALKHGADKMLGGDQAYTLTPFMTRPWPKEEMKGPSGPAKAAYNLELASVRVCAENYFGLVSQLWPFVHHGAYTLKLKKSPVAKWYVASILLTNVFSCLNGNCINVQFGTRTFDMESYLAGAPIYK